MAETDWAAREHSPEFEQLVAARRRFVVPALAERAAARSFGELRVRSETGAGAERAEPTGAAVGAA